MIKNAIIIINKVNFEERKIKAMLFRYTLFGAWGKKYFSIEIFNRMKKKYNL